MALNLFNLKATFNDDPLQSLLLLLPLNVLV